MMNWNLKKPQVILQMQAHHNQIWATTLARGIWQPPQNNLILDPVSKRFLIAGKIVLLNQKYWALRNLPFSHI